MSLLQKLSCLEAEIDKIIDLMYSEIRNLSIQKGYIQLCNSPLQYLIFYKEIDDFGVGYEGSENLKTTFLMKYSKELNHSDIIVLYKKCFKMGLIKDI